MWQRLFICAALPFYGEKWYNVKSISKHEEGDRMAVKILHTADLHMDSPFEALTEEKAAERRREQRDMLSRIADICENEQVQIVLMAGDLLDSAASYYETHESLCRVFEKIKAHIFIAPGNHDYYCRKSPYEFLKMPENVHIFTAEQIECEELSDIKCRVWGAGFTSVNCGPLLRGFEVTPKEEGVTDIMVIHGELAGNTYNPISETDIEKSGLDYLALGHTHSFSGFLKAGKTVYAYPGCPEGRGFDELGEKGVIVGTVSENGCDLRFAATAKRKYEAIRLDLTGKTDIAAEILAALPQGTENDIYKIVLTGEYGEKIDLPLITEKLKDKFYSLSLRDKTRPVSDIWSALDEDTLKGLFLKRMKRAYDEAEEEDRAKISLAIKYGLGALENREGWQP